MNDHEIDALVGASATIDDTQVAALHLSAQKLELMEEIMSAPPLEKTADVTPLPVPSGRRRRTRLLALVAAVAITAAVVVVQPFRDEGAAWAAELVAVAEAAPRLLVADGAWTVQRVDAFDAAYGEITFTDGERTADLHWWEPDDFAGHIADRTSTADLVREIDVLGNPATLARYAGTDDYTTSWLYEDHTLQLRGEFPSVDDYLAVLESLEPVDIDAWLSAMPASVVKPDEMSATAAAMLEGVPLPDGFDIAVAGLDGKVTDRYQVGARVSGAVACAWIAQWLDATAAGDETAAQEAVDAMATSHTWPILLEMDPQGGWSGAVWEYADAIGGDGTVIGGRTLTVEESYQDALGC